MVPGDRHPGDGGGGTFYWDAGSQATADGGTVIAPACRPRGRWIRPFTGPVSVKWFGATVDGQHNDREAVQAALNSANVVLIPAGSCAIYDAPVSIPAGTTLMGAGPSATTLTQCTPGQEVVHITDATDASLIGVAIVSSGSAHAVHVAAVLDAADHVTLREVWVKPAFGRPGFGSPGKAVTGVDGNSLQSTAHGLTDGQIVQLSAGSDSLLGVNVAFSASGDTVSTGSQDHGLRAGDPVQFVDVEDANAVPAELKAPTRYYVVNPTATTFQVATTRGSSTAIRFTPPSKPGVAYVWPMVPGGLEPYLEYFVVNATADTFQLSMTMTPGEKLIAITDAPASTCKVGVVYAGILLESAGQNLYSPRIRDCKVDGGADYTDGGARHGIRSICTTRGQYNVVGGTIIGGETANVKVGVSSVAAAETIAVAHHVYNTADGSGGGAAFAASGNNALQGSDNRIEGGAPAAERAVVFYPTPPAAAYARHRVFRPGRSSISTGATPGGWR